MAKCHHLAVVAFCHKIFRPKFPWQFAIDCVCGKLPLESDQLPGTRSASQKSASKAPKIWGNGVPWHFAIGINLKSDGFNALGTS